jgi:hypothetical protein
MHRPPESHADLPQVPTAAVLYEVLEAIAAAIDEDR